MRINYKLLLEEDYVTEDGKVITKDDLTYLNRGVNSLVWKTKVDEKDYAIKTFLDDRYKYCLTYETFQRMKELDLQNIVKAIGAVRKESSNQQIDGYLMDFIEENRNGILTMPMDNFMESISRIQDDILVLSKNKILMDDIKADNSICSIDNKLFLSDIDMFYYSDNFSYNTVLESNYNDLVDFVRHLILQQICNNDNITFSQCSKVVSEVNRVFAREEDLFIEPKERVEKVLYKHKSLDDYFKSKLM